MRRPNLKWAGFLLVVLALLPGRGQAQPDATGYAPPDHPSPFPLYSTRPESGMYVFGAFTYYRQNNPLQDQPIAQRGFIDADGSVTGTPGTFVGSLTSALDTGKVDGPTNYQPGFRVGLGWRWADGTTVEGYWMHWASAQSMASASLAPPFLRGGPNLADTYLSAPVYNFPSDFAGPQDDVIGADGQPHQAFGIWNAADVMTLKFTQRNEFFGVNWRVPMYETECWRTYGIIGPQFVWFWERFRWYTIDADLGGGASIADQAIYTNIVSNRMYGLNIGIGNEWYLGNGLAVSLDLQAAGMLNVVKERAKYERADKGFAPESKRARTDYTLVPELRGTANLFYYPMEGVQLKIGYDVMTFFNTVASPKPVVFDYGAMNPQYDRVFRILDGFEVGISLIF